MGPRPVFRLRLGDRVAVKRIQTSGLVHFSSSSSDEMLYFCV